MRSAGEATTQHVEEAASLLRAAHDGPDAAAAAERLTSSSAGPGWLDAMARVVKPCTFSSDDSSEDAHVTAMGLPPR